MNLPMFVCFILAGWQVQTVKAEWFLGEPLESCDTVCDRNGKVCSETEFAINNNNVDSSYDLLNLIKKLGGTTSATSCVSANYLAVPLFNKDEVCMYSEIGRRVRPSTFDCTKVAGPPDALKQRICYCHAVTESCDPNPCTKTGWNGCEEKNGYSECTSSESLDDNDDQTECTENLTWATAEGNGGEGWKCSDYTSNKWCENGGIGSEWNSDWSWKEDADGQDARDVCCECGGKGLGEINYIMARPTTKCSDLESEQYRFIVGPKECESASEHFGAPFKGSSDEWDWPVGCYVTKTYDDDGKLIASLMWNEHYPGTQNSRASSVCTNAPKVTKETVSQEAQDKEYRQLQLEKHDAHRAKHGSPEMALDEELNEIAQAYAEKLAEEGKTLTKDDHDPTLGEIYQGENLGQICATKEPFRSFDEVTDGWYGEEADYDYNTRDCKETSSPNCVTGHFTQVVWKNSTKLGIGRAYGMVGQTYCTWTVARYVPPGNYVDQHEENVLDPENV